MDEENDKILFQFSLWFECLIIAGGKTFLEYDKQTLFVTKFLPIFCLHQVEIQESSVIEHRFFMVVEIPNHFHTKTLHVDHGYATSFLPKGTHPLFSPTLQFTLEYIRITFVQNLMAFPCWNTLYNVESCKFSTVCNSQTIVE